MGIFKKLPSKKLRKSQKHGSLRKSIKTKSITTQLGKLNNCVELN